LELQQCALLPVELARATNGYIDATEPFKLAKGSSSGARLDTVLAVAANALRQALIGLLPVLPHKAADGLRQLAVVADGRTLDELFSSPLPPGTKLGQAEPLFPKLDAP
jgi:methionyl-tRNA synthetase